MNHVRRICRSLAGLTRGAGALPADGVAVPAAVAIPPRPPGWAKAPIAARHRADGDRGPDAGSAATRSRPRRRKGRFTGTALGVLPHTI